MKHVCDATENGFMDDRLVTFGMMGIDVNLCITAHYNKETDQYEITKDDLWESFEAQVKNNPNAVTKKVLYCIGCGREVVLPYYTSESFVCVDKE